MPAEEDDLTSPLDWNLLDLMTASSTLTSMEPSNTWNKCDLLVFRPATLSSSRLLGIKLPNKAMEYIILTLGECMEWSRAPPI